MHVKGRASCMRDQSVCVYERLVPAPEGASIFCKKFQCAAELSMLALGVDTDSRRVLCGLFAGQLCSVLRLVPPDSCDIPKVIDLEEGCCHECWGPGPSRTHSQSPSHHGKASQSQGLELTSCSDSSALWDLSTHMVPGGH